MNPWDDFRENIGKNTKTIYRCVIIHALCICAALFHLSLPTTFAPWIVIILAIILHFKVLQSVYKISELYEKVASLLLDPTAFQFYKLDQKLNQDSEKLQQITIEKAKKTMDSSKSREFINKYRRYHRVKRNVDTAFFVYAIFYIFGLRSLSSFLHLTSWIWQLIFDSPFLVYWFGPFYVHTWKTVRNGRNLSIAMLSFTLKKIMCLGDGVTDIKQIDS